MAAAKKPKKAPKRFNVVRKGSLLPKTITHNGVKYYLLDRQYSKTNAEYSANLYQRIGPQGAKYLIRHDTLSRNGVTEDYYGIYTSARVGVVRRKRK